VLEAMPDDEVLSYSELASRLSVSETLIQNWVRDGVIDGHSALGASRRRYFGSKAGIAKLVKLMKRHG
jgi:hypothetical protein